MVNEQALEGYRQKLVMDVGKLYDKMAGSIVNIDALLAFYFELFGHCDGSLRDLVRSKLAMLFKGPYKEGVQGLDMSR